MHLGIRELITGLFILCCAIVCGGWVVRWVLQWAGISVDLKAGEALARRGMIIGYLERFIIVFAVAGGHYDALGFLVAAKGLIRSKELEEHERAEYFLVGTLASCAVGLVGGILVRVFVPGLAKI